MNIKTSINWKKVNIYFLICFLYLFLSHQFKFEVTPYLQDLNSSNLLIWIKIIFLIVLNFFEKPILFYFWARSFYKELTIENLNSLVKEYLRSVGSILFWSLFFIIPGLIRYIQLYWVNTIVLLKPSYSSGHLDALTQSKKITLKHLKLTILLICLVDFIVPMALDFLTIKNTLIVTILHTGIISCFFFFHIYLFNKIND